MTRTLVRIQNVEKRFGAVCAVDGVSLEVNEGELLVLLGPSGCGKTTLLRCLAGLERVDSGSILVDDLDLTFAEPQVRPVGLVFQDFALYPHKTVRDNIALSLRVRRWARRDIESRVDEVASMLQISELLDRYPKQLSGGQKQRVGVGRAIARRPRVLLMDEPLSNLDAKLRLEMRREIANLRHALHDTAIVYVTHDQEEAMTLGDRLAVLNGGRVMQVGTAQQLYGEPQNLFVAQFLGLPPINVIEAGPAGWAAVRPEHVYLGTPAQDGTVSLGQGRLVDVEDHGHSAVARYQIANSEISVRLGAADAPPAVGLHVEAHRLLWFDQAGQRRAAPAAAHLGGAIDAGKV